MHQRVRVDRGCEIILQAAGEMEFVLGGHILDALEQLGRAAPADFDAAEQIGLRARHLEQALRLEGRLRTENIGIGLEADFGAAAVVDLAEVFELALGMAALEIHPIELLAAGDFDLEPRRQRVHHGNADAVQTAGSLVDLGIEFAAGVQRAHDDFERRLLRKLRMRVDGNAAAVVGDGEEAVGIQLDLDEIGVAGQRLVHRVVDHLGEEMVQRLLVGAADIHARPAPDRLQTLQHLDVGRGVAGLGARGDFQRRAALWPPPWLRARRKGRWALAFAVDFKDLAMSFHVLRAKRAPRIGSRDYATDGPENVTARPL